MSILFLQKDRCFSFVSESIGLSEVIEFKPIYILNLPIYKYSIFLQPCIGLMDDILFQ